MIERIVHARYCFYILNDFNVMKLYNIAKKSIIKYNDKIFDFYMLNDMLKHI